MRRIILSLLAITPTLCGALPVSLQQIPITYLPYTITTPGNYYLATDLVATLTLDPTNESNGISIVHPATGNITLDLRGHKITEASTNTEFWAIQVREAAYTVGRGSVLIENGTLSGFPYAMLDAANNVTVNNMTFVSISIKGSGQELQVDGAQNTTVENCLFTGPTDCAIYERNNVPVAHNAFINNRFANQFLQFGLVGQNMLIDGSSNSNLVPMATTIPLIEN
jgi:hypothetical protein